MFSLKYSRRFKKDLKLYKYDKKVLTELELILDYLVKDINLPKQYKNHKLTGEFKGCFECHVKPDILLVYKVEKSDLLILLLRINTHSNLF